MAITISLNIKGIRGSHPTHRSVTAWEIRPVKLSDGWVGLNISSENGRATASIRIDDHGEARMLAALLIEGADRAEALLERQRAEAGGRP